MVPYENIQFQLVDTPPLSQDHMEPGLADLIRRADILIILLDLHGDALEQLESTLSLLRELRVFPEGEPIPEDLKKPPFIKRVLLVVNKMDQVKDEEDYEVFLELSETSLPSLGISARTKRNLPAFIERIFDLSSIIRAYTKAPGKEPDLSAPFVVPRGSTLEDLTAKIHKDFQQKLKFARIWGKEVYDGQMVQRDYVLQDGDVVEMHI